MQCYYTNGKVNQKQVTNSNKEKNILVLMIQSQHEVCDVGSLKKKNVWCHYK